MLVALHTADTDCISSEMSEEYVMLKLEMYLVSLYQINCKGRLSLKHFFVFFKICVPVTQEVILI